MQPIFLTDGSQRFFDLDTSTVITQQPVEGADMESELIYTFGGNWILKTINADFAEFSLYTQISHAEACQWLYKYGYDSNNSLHFRIA